MNIKEYIKYAKKVLKEDAGSEGMEYKIKAKSGLKAYKDDIMTIDEVVSENGETVARAKFTYPLDYGFALSTITEALEGIEITSLSLVY